MGLQLTQSDGKANMHLFIIASVLPFPVLEWDNAHLVLILLCTRTYRVIAFFITELHFRSLSLWVLVRTTLISHLFFYA